MPPTSPTANSLLLKEFITLLAKETLSLAESGLGGHLMHLYDNPWLTLGSIKEIFRKSMVGRLQAVTEKTDGQNIFFTFNVAENTLKFGRNKGNIKTGGMNLQDITTKWAHLPKVQEAYVSAYKILDKGVRAISPQELTVIFGTTGTIWYSAEIITTVNPNVINYDRNVIIIHESGTIYDSEGKPTPQDTTYNFKRLKAAVDPIQAEVAKSGWMIAGPVMVPLTRLGSNKPLIQAIERLNKIQATYGVDDNTTIVEYLAAWLSKNYQIPLEDAAILATPRMTMTAKKQMLIEKNGELSPGQEKVLGNLDQVLRKANEPLEKIVYDFSVEVLKGVQSLVVASPKKEVQRLQTVVKSAIEDIQNSNNQTKIAKLQKNLEKLQSTDNITSSMEGYVFKYKGNSYKFTGAFGPVNQILGLFRY